MSTRTLEGVNVLCRLRLDPGSTGQNECLILDRATLVEAAKVMYKDQWFLEDVAVSDVLEGFLAMYHFARWEQAGRVTLKALAPHDDPSFPSIAGVYQGAEWHERESMDFYAVRFTGIPNDAPLLLTEDMIGLGPLRKDEKNRKSWLDLMPAFEIIESPEDHPLVALVAQRKEAAEKAAKEAEEKKKAAAEKAKKAAAEKAAAGA